MSLTALSGDALLACFDYLPMKDLSNCMQLNNRIGARCRVGNQWKKFVQELLSGFTDKSECDYYNLCRDVVVMRRSKQTELVTEGLIASTTDDLNQTVHQTVNNKYTSFWSSCGDATEDGEDSVCYLLAGEGCVVDEVSLVFYQADYQQNAPIYYSKSLQIMVGYPTDENQFRDTITSIKDKKLTTHDSSIYMEDGFCWTYISDHFEVKRTEDCQTFKLPQLAVGSIVKCVLHGKTTRQAQDSLFYVCLQKFWCRGKLVSELPTGILTAVKTILSGQAEGISILERVLCPKGQSLDIINAPIEYSVRGEDTKTEFANRKLNLFTDAAVKKYGANLYPPLGTQEEIEEHQRDILQLQSLFKLYKKYHSMGA